ncbi:MAG TPA: LysE family translocator [Candidatus Krumholzibacteria bacterium]
MTIQTWTLFCATEAVLSFIPGPAVLYVISSAIAHGSRAGVVASLSILAGNTVYFILSAMGLGALLLASRPVFVAIQWIGAAYLVYLGLRMLLSRTPHAPESGTEMKPARHAGVFWNGFVTQISNPKAIIFFAALLPQFIDPDESAARQIAILGVSSVVVEFIVLSVYVAGCRAAGRWLRAPRYNAWLVRVAGLLLVIAGARLAATHGIQS